MLIQDYLRASAERFPNKEVLIHRGKSRSYEELSRDARSAANWILNSHPEPSFRGAILTDDPVDYVTAYFAILLAGGIVVGLNTQTSDRSLREIIDDCQVSVLFTNARFQKHFGVFLSDSTALTAIAVRGKCAEAQAGTRYTDYGRVLSPVEPGADFAPPRQRGSDIAQIIYTSGTTGAPKGVMLSHSNLIANTNSVVAYLHLNERDRIMAVLPFFYSYGNSLLLTHIAVGGSLVVNQNLLYPAEILDEMTAHRATGFSGVPSTFAILLHRSPIRDYRFPDLRYVTQAGGPMSPAMAKELKAVLPEVDVYIMYGQTEASARLSYLEPDQLQHKAGSIGKAIPGVTLDVLDPKGNSVPVGVSGEIVARGDNIMRGYWGQPEATGMVVRDGALWTGDLARVDVEGYLFIVGRKTDMIKSGAHRIGPKAIEDVLLEHGAVDEAAVVGVPDEILGEIIRACVVLKPGVKCTAKQLTLHCRKLLASYKVPHELEFLPRLPKTATGKIKKAELRTERRSVVSSQADANS